ncbi:uncharacterized protein LOC130649342 [Hydractinia symbiolongicarpus]|uniref:uncharacterized protein LOC130647674 n=1 Tax=Hydractinia symbiolongicarpus TaxID=13093 RepID=UPI00254DCF81|nr:uncharacterized protein LOC130647674 [Hydractinia symbiolongicarpus]XP_057311624.1 uncharacterized protein LOC130649342 [Hydractinia symbiolongicarpus]
MSLLHRFRSPSDPSNFLRALQNRMHTPNIKEFHYNNPQDVPETLLVAIDELIGSSSLVSNLRFVSLTTTTSCSTRLCSSSKKQKETILTLPTCKSIGDSFEAFSQSQQLVGDDKWFCPQCLSHQESTTETQISSCGDVLVVQLLRYASDNSSSFKDARSVNCLPTKHHELFVLSHPTDEISFSNKYRLFATINHLGTLKAGRLLKINETLALSATTAEFQKSIHLT